MKILPYPDSDFSALVQFLQANWAPCHALYDKRLFDWQYRTGQSENSLLVVDGHRILAFLGNVPATYQVRGQLTTGVGLTMWCVDKEYRNSGLGILLIREAERMHRVTLTLGANVNVVPMYQRMGYSALARLHRYVVPLQFDGYRHLLTTPADESELREWCAAVQSQGAPNLPDSPPTAAAMAALYSRSIPANFAFSQSRDADFWQWRYLDSAGFRYHLLGDPQSTGAAVVRIEQVIAPDQPHLQSLRVLRIIELLPANPDVWHGCIDPAFITLLRSLLCWGQTRGCVAADFQCSNSRLSHVLAHAGFREQIGDGQAPPTSLAQLFQPFRPNANPINFVWKVKGDDAKPIAIDPEDAYFVKSDCDMDRPNVWPLPVEE
jgi:GNAT superfamily N-acetyltransferase